MAVPTFLRWASLQHEPSSLQALLQPLGVWAAVGCWLLGFLGLKHGKKLGELVQNGPKMHPGLFLGWFLLHFLWDWRGQANQFSERL